jgi:hypothetical protein
VVRVAAASRVAYGAGGWCTHRCTCLASFRAKLASNLNPIFQGEARDGFSCDYCSVATWSNIVPVLALFLLCDGGRPSICAAEMASRALQTCFLGRQELRSVYAAECLGLRIAG